MLALHLLARLDLWPDDIIALRLRDIECEQESSRVVGKKRRTTPLLLQDAGGAMLVPQRPSVPAATGHAFLPARSAINPLRSRRSP
jgi:hypothetical protein